jgi:hypothetical protein
MNIRAPKLPSLLFLSLSLSLGSTVRAEPAPLSGLEEPGEEQQYSPHDTSEHRALRKESAELRERVNGPAASAEDWAKLAEVESRLGRLHAAAVEFRKAAGLERTNQGRELELAKSELEEGEFLLRHSRPAGAHRHFQAAHKLAKQAEDKKLEEKAEDLAREASNQLDVFFSDVTDIGFADGNHFQYTRNLFTAPIRDSEFSFLAGENTYAARNFTGAAVISYPRAGVRYNLDPTWSLSGIVGGDGTYDVNLRTDSAFFQAGVRLVRDYCIETPLALDSSYKFFAQQAFYNWSVTNWINVNGDFSHEGYTDSSNQYRYNVGLAILPINRPNHEQLSIVYNHSGDHNDTEVDELLRFAPASLEVNSIGMRWQQNLTKNLNYHIAYDKTFTNEGLNFDNEVVGLESELGEGSKLGVEFSHGPFRDGRILLSGLGISPANYNVHAELKVAF